MGKISSELLSHFTKIKYLDELKIIEFFPTLKKFNKLVKDVGSSRTCYNGDEDLRVYTIRSESLLSFRMQRKYVYIYRFLSLRGIESTTPKFIPNS